MAEHDTTDYQGPSAWQCHTCGRSGTALTGGLAAARLLADEHEAQSHAGQSGVQITCSLSDFLPLLPWPEPEDGLSPSAHSRRVAACQRQRAQQLRDEASSHLSAARGLDERARSLDAVADAFEHAASLEST